MQAVTGIDSLLYAAIIARPPTTTRGTIALTALGEPPGVVYVT